jgi:hypothetical protein
MAAVRGRDNDYGEAEARQGALNWRRMPGVMCVVYEAGLA